MTALQTPPIANTGHDNGGGVSAWWRHGVLPVALCLVLGCGGGGANGSIETPSGAAVPAWVIRDNTRPGMVCARGMVGRTLFPQDGRKYAEEVARRNLSFAIYTRVKSRMYSQTGTSGTSGGAVTSVETAEWATNCAIEKAECLAVWNDPNGAVPGGPVPATYALVCVAKGEVVRCEKAGGDAR